MGLLGTLAMVSFALVSLVVGGRILGRCQGTDRSIGVGLLFLGAIGPIGLTAASAVASAEMRTLLWGLSIVCLNVGATAIYAFTYLVFRTGHRTIQTFAILGIAACWVSFTGQLLFVGFDRIAIFEPWGYLGLLGRLGSMAQTALVSLQEWRRARRRLALGLTDPWIVRRYLFWGIAAGCAAGIFTMNLVRNLLGDHGPESAIALVVTPVFGVVSAGFLAFAFERGPRKDEGAATA